MSTRNIKLPKVVASSSFQLELWWKRCLRLTLKLATWILCRFAIKRSGFSCPRCKRGYSNRDVYLDLTVLGDSQEYNEVYTPGIEIFRYQVSHQCFFKAFNKACPIRIEFVKSSIYSTGATGNTIFCHFRSVHVSFKLLETCAISNCKSGKL